MSSSLLRLPSPASSSETARVALGYRSEVLAALFVVAVLLLALAA